MQCFDVVKYLCLNQQYHKIILEYEWNRENNINIY